LQPLTRPAFDAEKRRGRCEAAQVEFNQSSQHEDVMSEVTSIANIQPKDNATSQPIAVLKRSYFEWPDNKVISDREGQFLRAEPYRKSLDNVAYFLDYCGAKVRRNLFSENIELNGLSITDLELKKLWFAACKKGLPDGLQYFTHMVEIIADRYKYHPVMEYLDTLKWDGKERVDRWLCRYLGAENTSINLAFGRVTLLGAVCRVMYPGCKFDYMLVLEGPQGNLKSSAIALLAGAWYSDSLQLGQLTRETVEQTGGKWMVEVAELSQMPQARVEQVKAQISRQSDRARLSYARFAQDFPRQFIMIGTTNNREYLRDPTGNRRFLPVMTGKIRLKELEADRDQLWAEAYHRAKAGERPVLPEALWAAAAQAQEARRIIGPVEERILELVGGIQDIDSIISKEELWQALEPVTKRTQAAANIMTTTMRRLGWQTAERRRTGKQTYCYVASPEAATWVSNAGNGFGKPPGRRLALARPQLSGVEATTSDVPR
jgi:predicted P-loop ATPase